MDKVTGILIAKLAPTPVFGVMVPPSSPSTARTSRMPNPVPGWVMWPKLPRTLLAPAAVPAKFEAFPREIALRPSHLRASAAEAMLVIPAAYGASVPIVAGEGDRIVDIDGQSSRHHDDIPGSTFRRIKGGGHLVHQTATGEVMSAIDDVEREIATRI